MIPIRVYVRVEVDVKQNNWQYPVCEDIGIQVYPMVDLMAIRCVMLKIGLPATALLPTTDLADRTRLPGPLHRNQSMFFARDLKPLYS